jgi:hypothetical protein
MGVVTMIANGECGTALRMQCGTGMLHAAIFPCLLIQRLHIQQCSKVVCHACIAATTSLSAAMHKHGLSQERAASCFWVLDNKGLITRVSYLAGGARTHVLCGTFNQGPSCDAPHTRTLDLILFQKQTHAPGQKLLYATLCMCPRQYQPGSREHLTIELLYQSFAFAIANYFSGPRETI